MTRLLALFLLACGVAAAQFHDLGTTEDGSVVYFTTRHRRAGTGEPFQGRVYAVDGSGPRVFEERERRVVTDRFPILTTPYDMIGVDVSADGETIALVGRSDCSGSSSGRRRPLMRSRRPCLASARMRGRGCDFL